MDEMDALELSGYVTFKWNESDIDDLSTVISLPDALYERDVPVRHKWVELETGEEIAIIPLKQTGKIDGLATTSSPEQYQEFCDEFLAGKSPDEIYLVFSEMADVDSVRRRFSNQSISVYSPEEVEQIVRQSDEITIQEVLD